jgi:hypothetical protein
MAERYNVNDRYWGGSMEPRLNPRCVDPRLNVKLRPSWPSPMVRATGEPIQEQNDFNRRGIIGLPDRFRK